MSPGQSLNPPPGALARPLVAGEPNRWPIWLFGGVLAAIAIGLFVGLEARRTTLTSPSISAAGAPAVGTISAPPELEIPFDPALANSRVYTFPMPPGARPVSAPTLVVPRQDRAAPRARVPQPPQYTGDPELQPNYGPPQPRSDEPTVVFQAPQGPAPPPVDPAGNPTLITSRAEADRLLNPGTTVPQGALVQAVLETALDSNRPGFARAIVSRDVHSFDGSRVLIPRGSRIYGEYRADLIAGQNRAFILWQRLLRPDGVTIVLGSPAADPLGRTGVRGRVNSHFLARFGAALLQSTLDIGVGLATRAVSDDTVILALPGSTQNVSATLQDNVRPTLTVRQGTSVSVFVARDLDFSAMEN